MNSRFLIHSMLEISLALLLVLASTVRSAEVVSDLVIPSVVGDTSHQPNLKSLAP